jgi:hypothetical protein
VEKMTIWWAPDGSKWDGLAGFHINGELRMPAGIDGSTKPPVVTVTISIPKVGGSQVLAAASVSCDVSGQNSVWQYNAKTGWPFFPYDVLD